MAPLAMTNRRRPAAIVGALALAAALSACGGTTQAQASPTEVRSATIAGLGRVLVDRAGLTLYAYIPDHRGASRCFGMCAHQWPPLLLHHGQPMPVAGAGVKRALLGTSRRPGGARQVTYDGWPLYTYFQDAAPGQATGQAAGMGTWYTVSVRGTIDHGVVQRRTG